MRVAPIGFIVMLAPGGALGEETPAAHGAAGDPPPAAAAARVLQCDGLFGPKATHAKLTEAFGANNVVRAKQDGAEGETYMATVLFPKGSADKLVVTWKDDKRLIGPDSLGAKGETSKWALPNGLHVGSKIADVEAANGKPFTLSGFHWDYGGFVQDWKGGALAKDVGPCTLTVRFNPGDDAVGDKVSGEKTFASNAAAMKAAKPFVSEITLTWK